MSKRGKKAIGIHDRHERKGGRHTRRREEQKTIDIRDEHEKIEGDRHTRRREEQKTISIRDGHERQKGGTTTGTRGGKVAGIQDG